MANGKGYYPKPWNSDHWNEADRENAQTQVDTSKPVSVHIISHPNNSVIPVRAMKRGCMLLDVGWLPGVTENRHIKGAPLGEVRETVTRKKGNLFFSSPAKLDSLNPDEYDNKSDRFFRAKVIVQKRKGKDMFLFRDEATGVILIPYKASTWKKWGIINMAGEIVELRGTPDRTCFRVMPRWGFARLDTYSEMMKDTSREDLLKRVIESEEEQGFVRLGSREDSSSVHVGRLMGIDIEDGLTPELIKERFRTVYQQQPPEGVSQSDYSKAVRRAKEILDDFIEKGILFLAELEEEENPEEASEEATKENVSAIGDEFHIVKCPSCNRHNKVLREQDPEVAMCGACEGFLFPSTLHDLAEKATEAIAIAIESPQPAYTLDQLQTMNWWDEVVLLADQWNIPYHGKKRTVLAAEIYDHSNNWPNGRNQTKEI